MKARLSKEAYQMVRNSSFRAILSATINVNYMSFSRWVLQKHENLTLYKVLAGISNLTGKPIDELVVIEEDESKTIQSAWRQGNLL